VLAAMKDGCMREKWASYLITVVLILFQRRNNKKQRKPMQSKLAALLELALMSVVWRYGNLWLLGGGKWRHSLYFQFQMARNFTVFQFVKND